MNPVKGFSVCSFFFIAFIIAPLFSPQAFAITYLDNVNILSDTLWTKAESPYVVSGKLYISSGINLTIEPGVSVKFFEDSYLDSDGGLNALGTEAEPINFSSVYDEYGGDILNDCGEVITEENTGSGDGQCSNVGIDEKEFYKYEWDGFEINGGSINIKHANIYHTYGVIYLAWVKSAFFDNLKFSKSHSGLEIYNSNASIENSEFSYIKDYPLFVYRNSVVNAKNLKFIGNLYEVEVSDNANLIADNLLIDGVTNSSAIDICYGGMATISSTTIKNVYENGIDIFAGGYLNIKDSVIENFQNNGYGIDIFGEYGEATAKLVANNLTFLGGKYDGLRVSDNSEVSISKSKINNFLKSGIKISNGAKVFVDSSEISNNGIGIKDDTYIDEPAVSNLEIKNSSISNNSLGGVSSWRSLVPMKAVGNYWGDASGPYNANLNAVGKGNAVVLGVEFIPWLTSDPTKKASCCSNVVFIPGLEASRLYVKGLLFENQLWEPNRNADVEKLYLNTSGESLDKNIYTRDIIKTTNVGMGVLDSNVYKSFADMMDAFVVDKKINNWEALPYDWRMDLNKIVTEPVKLENGGSYNFVDEIIKLAESSQTKKVSIVTHSNGGLVAKTLINELKKRGKENLIDQLVMVASPELGTPSAVSGILHGDEQEVAKGLLMNKSTARTLGENMMGAYNLLPSLEYFKKVASPVIEFDASVDKVNNFRAIYGDKIDSYEKLKNFFLGIDGRVEPANIDTNKPNLLKGSLLSLAEENHNAIDVWVPPENIKVTELAGWGVSTVRGVKYFGREDCVANLTNCVKTTVLDRRPLYTTEGDKTVVSPSASVGSSTYYLDMRKLKNIHKNILEASSTLEFTKNILLNSTSTLPEYVTKEKPISTDKTLEIALHSPVSIDVYDTLGRHTGLINNPNPNSDLQAFEENIPGSRYIEFGEGKYVLLEDGTAYNIKLQGLDTGTFTLESNTLSSSGEMVSSSQFVDIPTSPDMKGEILVSSTSTASTSVAIKIDVNGDGKNDFTINPNTEFDPIVYLQILRKTVETFNASQKTKNEIYKKIDGIIKSLEKNKTKNAILKIKQFSRELSVKQKHKQMELDKKHKGERDIKHSLKKKKLNSADAENLLQMLNQLLNNLI